MVVFQTKTEQNPLFSIPRRKAKIFAYGFLLALVACTAYVAFFPSPLASPSFSGFFSTAPYRSRFSPLLSRFFPQQTPDGFGGNLGESGFGSSQNGVSEKNMSGSGFGSKQNGGFEKNVNGSVLGQKQNDVFEKNVAGSGFGSLRSGDFEKNRSGSGVALQRSSDTGVFEKNQTKSVSASEQIGVLFRNNSSSGTVSKQSEVLPKNQTRTRSVSGGNGVSKKNSQESVSKNSATSVGISERNRISNVSATQSKSSGSSSEESSNPDRKNRSWSVESMRSCDIFHGNWVKDDSYPLYPHGSCPHIDEPFNCYLNGRLDTPYQKLRWQPSGCNIPRLNATDMLERLRGKRLVFVGDSLNRNMWESLVCILRNSVNDKTKVFEASGRHEFRTEGSYSFLFKDYGCTVEFFRSPFLVQEWEIPETNGSKKETLRLDVIERSSSRYKDADVIIFNTGHWWTHEKTSKGKDYYQEGNKIYSELNVVEAFHKALNTWSKWIDTNINKKKTLVFFRGYSASHFRGGQWNSGGQCDSETEPIKNEKYLSTYPPKMSILESVLKGMKTTVSYLNITRMTDYRKDGHPSIYRKAKLTEAERRSANRYQDCSHWCLPGVPDSWNELLYAQLLIKQNKNNNQYEKG